MVCVEICGCPTEKVRFIHSWDTTEERNAMIHKIFTDLKVTYSKDKCCSSSAEKCIIPGEVHMYSSCGESCRSVSCTFTV